VLFVALGGRTKINLAEGEFAVLDANATDGTGAFQLPVPDADADGITEYSVYSRALGTPGGSSTTTTCATDPVTGEVICSTLSSVLVRTKGKSSFTNVSAELLYVVADIDGDGDSTRCRCSTTARRTTSGSTTAQAGADALLPDRDRHELTACRRGA
jgi:hypothetical protein